MKLLARAKINLFLRVVRKRPDGYHELETLFERVSLADELSFRSASDGRVRLVVTGERLGAGPDNLVLRAAELLRRAHGPRLGARIRLVKRIPVSAGLGGGSSDAAAALVGLNRLWRLGLSKRRLLEHAAELGSDVPFFVLDEPFALGTGRGEILRPIRRPAARIWHVLAKPPHGISTRRAYETLPPHGLTPPGADVRMLFRSVRDGNSHLLSRLVTNSLEHADSKRLRKSLELKQDLLDQGALAALLSGSGPTVFGLFSTRSDALRAQRVLRTRHKALKTFVVATA